MRKILIFTRHGISVLSAACRRASLAAFGVGLAVTSCCPSDATAQTFARQLEPGSPKSYIDAAASGAPLPSYVDDATVDASYSVMSDQTRTELAAHRGGGRMVDQNLGYSTDPCNAGCDLTYYFNVEGLWLRRENDERFSLSRNSLMPQFQYEFGGRYTVGRLLDCVNGYELSYVGPFNWQRASAVTGAGNLQSNFLPRNGFTGAQVTAFNNANQHVQAYQARMNSIEINRRWWAWDVVSTMIGVRYVDYDESYLFLSTSPGVGTGLFAQRVNNQMIGAQVGGDMIYPISLRGNYGIRGKAGVYGNFDDQSTLLQNAGVTVINSGDDHIDVAGLFEFGIFANYHIVPSIRLTAGYEFWYIPGMTSVPEQSPAIVTPTTGTRIVDNDDIFLHGGSVGVQVLF